MILSVLPQADQYDFVYTVLSGITIINTRLLQCTPPRWSRLLGRVCLPDRVTLTHGYHVVYVILSVLIYRSNFSSWVPRLSIRQSWYSVVRNRNFYNIYC